VLREKEETKKRESLLLTCSREVEVREEKGDANRDQKPFVLVDEHGHVIAGRYTTAAPGTARPEPELARQSHSATVPATLLFFRTSTFNGGVVVQRASRASAEVLDVSFAILGRSPDQAWGEILSLG
jgi:hypothetical protein